MVRRVSRTFVNSIFVPALAVVFIHPAGTAAQQSSGIPQIGPQGQIVLDLEIAIKSALEQSWRMERVRLDIRRDRYNLEASRAGLKSNASLSLTLPNYDQSIKEIINPETGDPKVLSTRAARYSSSISIRQPLPTDGVVSLNGALNRTSDKLFSYTHGRKAYYGRVFLRYEQPILQPNRIQNAIRNAQLRLERSELGFLKEQIDVINDISRSYFELYERTYMDQLAREELSRLEQIYDMGRRLFQRGTLTEIDLLQLEVDLNSRRDRASSAAGRLAREKRGFKQEIGLLQDVEIEVEPILTYTPVEIDVDLAAERALQYRPELRENEMWMIGQEMDLEARQARGRMTGTVSLTLGLEGRGGDIKDEFYHNIINPDQARGAAINFTIPLWDWGRNEAQVNERLTEMEKVRRSREETERGIRRSVVNVVDRVVEAQGRLTLLDRSVDAADRSYRLSMQQFESGELNVQDLLLTQGRLADSRRSYLNAYLDYRNALVDLERSTYWDWEENQPLSRTLATYVVTNGEF